MRVPMTTADFLDRAELVYGGRTGIVDDPLSPDAGVGRLTYKQFATRARAVAAGLDELGVGPGERVAVVSHNAGRMLELLFGVTAYGRICVPVNFRLQPEEVAYIIEHSGASTVLVDIELDAALAGITAKNRIVLDSANYDEGFLRPDREPEPWADPDEDATATINYTSGTTARPKGVQLTHRNIWMDAVTFGLHAAVTDRDVYMHTLPMFHCNGWGMPYIVAALGVPQVILRKVDGSEILRRVRDEGVTLMCGAPAVWNTVLDAAAGWDGEVPGRGRVRIVCAGAPPPTRTIARVEAELGWEFTQIYGLTETAPLLTVNRRRAEWDDLPPEERARLQARAGAPAIGVRLSTSSEGEVLARSNVVLAGYWQQPEETAKAMADDWFHTGDGGLLDDEGHLTISDRKKDIIITGGENVSSIEVEDALFSHPAVAEVAVIGVPSEKWGETIKALVVLAPGARASEAELIEHCKARLARYKAPTSVEFRDSIPRTATGKIQKFKLRSPYWEGHSRQVN